MKIIGHRGAKGLAPQNTLASFAKALEYHVDEIECDIRVSKDGVAVLEHNNKLQLPGLDQYEVSSYSLADLQRFKPDLPTLAEAIEFVNQQVVIQIEVKPKESVKPVVECVQSFLDKGWDVNKFIISSRDYRSLKQVKQLAPHIPLSVIQPWSGILAVRRARRLGTKRISMNEHVMWSYFIRSMSRRGWLLCGYAMNDLPRAKRWTKKYGLHGVITDFPDRFDKSKLN